MPASLRNLVVGLLCRPRLLAGEVAAESGLLVATRMVGS